MDGPLAYGHHNLQHIMMYAFFAIHPVLELGYYWRIDWIPPNLDYLSAILAYGVEAFLFHEHLLGRGSIDVQVSTYLHLKNDSQCESQKLNTKMSTIRAI